MKYLTLLFALLLLTPMEAWAKSSSSSSSRSSSMSRSYSKSISRPSYKTSTTRSVPMYSTTTRKKRRRERDEVELEYGSREWEIEGTRRGNTLVVNRRSSIVCNSRNPVSIQNGIRKKLTGFTCQFD